MLKYDYMSTTDENYLNKMMIYFATLRTQSPPNRTIKIMDEILSSENIFKILVSYKLEILSKGACIFSIFTHDASETIL